MNPDTASHLGFLTVIQEPGGFLGGYLVTNLWGRPLEFRLSTAVQPNRVQQILYGPTLDAYVAAELIGKTLVEKTNARAHLVLTDHCTMLELRRAIEIPVVWVAPPSDPMALALASAGLSMTEAAGDRGPIVAHPDFPDDVQIVKSIWARVGAGLDAAEPFSRIREAVHEARKMGVTHRAAG
ncbi:MAG: hypothetical protein ACJ8C4_16185 [Gemmataceae bacterium]